MKTEIKIVEKKKERKYPYIGQYSSDETFLVLFTASDEGTLLSVGSNTFYNIGAVSKNWNEKEYSVFEGKLILSN